MIIHYSDLTALFCLPMSELCRVSYLILKDIRVKRTVRSKKLKGSSATFPFYLNKEDYSRRSKGGIKNKVNYKDHSVNNERF